MSNRIIWGTSYLILYWKTISNIIDFLEQGISNITNFLLLDSVIELCCVSSGLYGVIEIGWLMRMGYLLRKRLKLTF